MCKSCEGYKTLSVLNDKADLYLHTSIIKKVN